MRCETNKPAVAIDRTVERVRETFVTVPQKSREPGIASASVKCLARSAQTSEVEMIPAAAVAGAESPGSQSSFALVRGIPTAARGTRVC